jgi:midasin
MGFRIFATQNPSTYSGRSLLSKAFRNRFVLMSFDNLNYTDLTQILRVRCSLPDSRANLLIKILKKLRLMRSSEQIFQGKEGLVTVRDLLKLGRRRIEGTKEDLALETFSLLGERVRQVGTKDKILKLIHQETGTTGNIEDFYNLILSEVDALGLDGFFEDTLFYEKRMNIDPNQTNQNKKEKLSQYLKGHQIQRTAELDRCMALVFRALKSKEPVLLVGETGCGKTTLVQIVAQLLNLEFTALNCHKNTEVSDFLGGFRPVRDHQTSMDTVRKWLLNVSGVGNVSDFGLIRLAESFIKFVEDFVWKVNQLEEGQWVDIREKFARLMEDSQSGMGNQQDFKSAIDGIIKSLCSQSVLSDAESLVSVNISELFENFEVVSSLMKIPKKFEWVDGSLVKAVRKGGVFLVDEISLASDNVLERLNSLLENERSLFIEKSENLWSRGKPLWDLLGLSHKTNEIIIQSKF